MANADVPRGQAECWRGPIREFRILLPVWGRRYVGQFLEFCLPSLLAGGNLPALCLRGRCTFVLMTREEDLPTVKASPLWAALERLCSVEIDPIDRLVSDSHSTTITLAYVAAIRSRAGEIKDTGFVFLVSDYVFADGALSKAIAPLEAGASGVLVGNFQVAQEGAASELAALRGERDALSLSPRTLMRMAMQHLHPATLASFADSPMWQGSGSNRLFWWVDETSVIGRFYLMHMIAIRPETDEFVIAAPSDYALIPELCPSGEVVHITDSDDYAVIELQPRQQAKPALRFGALEPKEFAGAVREWATEQHRQNACHPVLFHSEEASPAAHDAIERSGAFVSAVEACLPTPARPFRYHPYWYGAVDHHMRTTRQPISLAEIGALVGDPTFAARIGGSTPGLRRSLLGQFPAVRLWHPRWPDIRTLWQMMHRLSRFQSVAVVGDIPALAFQALQQRALSCGIAELSRISAEQAFAVDEAQRDAHDAYIVLAKGRPADGLWQFVHGGSRADGLVLVVIGDLLGDEVQPIEAEVLMPERTGFPDRLALEDLLTVEANGLRVAVQRAMMTLARATFAHASGHRLVGVVGLALLACLSGLCNLLSLTRRRDRTYAHCSSAFLLFRWRVAVPQG